jgi:hypothetical protein
VVQRGRGGKEEGKGRGHMIRSRDRVNNKIVHRSNVKIVGMVHPTWLGNAQIWVLCICGEQMQRTDRFKPFILVRAAEMARNAKCCTKYCIRYCSKFTVL